MNQNIYKCFFLISHDVRSLMKQKMKNKSLKQTSAKILVLHLVFLILLWHI